MDVTRRKTGRRVSQYCIPLKRRIPRSSETRVQRSFSWRLLKNPSQTPTNKRASPRKKEIDPPAIRSVDCLVHLRPDASVPFPAGDSCTRGSRKNTAKQKKGPAERNCTFDRRRTQPARRRSFAVAPLFKPCIDSVDPSVGRIVRNNETRYQAEDACTRNDARVARARASVACATVH